MNIPKDTGPRDEFPAPGTWRGGSSDGKPTAFFRCPKCPTYGSLVGTHEIADDGKVTPSMVCPNCDFHEWLTLDDWWHAGMPSNVRHEPHSTARTRG